MSRKFLDLHYNRRLQNVRRGALWMTNRDKDKLYNRNRFAPDIFLPIDSDFTNEGLGDQEVVYTSTSRQSIIRDDSELQAIEPNVPVIDNVDVVLGFGSFNNGGDSEDNLQINSTAPAPSDNLNCDDVISLYVTHKANPSFTEELYTYFGDGSNYLTFWRDSSGKINVRYRKGGSDVFFMQTTETFLTDKYFVHLSMVGNGTLITPTLTVDSNAYVGTTYNDIIDFTGTHEVGSYNQAFEMEGYISDFMFLKDQQPEISIEMYKDFLDKSPNNYNVVVNATPFNIGTVLLGDSESNGYIPQLAKENLIIKSYQPSDQTPTVLNATEYTLSVAEGEAIASGIGSATPGNPLTFTTTSTLQALLFVGFTRYVNLELGSEATRWIPTDSIASTRSATDARIDIPFTAEEGSVVATTDNTGTLWSTDGSDLSCSYDGVDITVSIRTTGGIISFQHSLAIEFGARIALAWKDKKYRLYANGDYLTTSDYSAFDMAMDDTQIILGNNEAGDDPSGHVKDFIIHSKMYSANYLTQETEIGFEVDDVHGFGLDDANGNVLNIEE